VLDALKNSALNVKAMDILKINVHSVLGLDASFVDLLGKRCVCIVMEMERQR
jgi:hypothetical protein